MIERRKSRRYPIILPALCWSRNRKDFYAVTQDISVDGILMRSATIPGLEEELIVSIPQIGSVGAQVIRAEGQSFVVKVLSRTQAAGPVARQLVLLSQQQDRTVEWSRARVRQSVPMLSREAWRGVGGTATETAQKF